jgi:hypothetical protein
MGLGTFPLPRFADCAHFPSPQHGTRPRRRSRGCCGLGRGPAHGFHHGLLVALRAGFCDATPVRRPKFYLSCQLQRQAGAAAGDTVHIADKMRVSLIKLARRGRRARGDGAASQLQPLLTIPLPPPPPTPQITGLTAVNVYTESDCENACCASDSCDVWQFCPSGSTNCQPASSCWTGPMGPINDGPGWISRGRNATPPAPPSSMCSDPRCQPGYDDSSWRGLDIPHDFVGAYLYVQRLPLVPVFAHHTIWV